MPSYIIHLAAFLALLAPHLALAQTDPFPQSRTATDWPFPWNSIWNHPIGDGAVYTPANIGLPTAYGMTVDEDILILTPDALPADVIAHDAGWDRNRTRCESIVSPLTVLESGLPIPGDFQTDPGYIGLTPNHSSAVLYADGVTVLESQPLHICESGAVVSQFVAGTMHLKEGDGIRGSHGGSGMSGIGGYHSGRRVDAGERHPSRLKTQSVRQQEPVLRRCRPIPRLPLAGPAQRRLRQRPHTRLPVQRPNACTRHGQPPRPAARF